MTTAFGLLVAVPAVWAYNYFTNKVEAFDVEMDNSSMELINYFILRRGAQEVSVGRQSLWLKHTQAAGGTSRKPELRWRRPTSSPWPTSCSFC